jgi:hypothetical protein
MKKLLLAATTVTAAIVTAAILAASGSAQNVPRTLNITETIQKGVGFFPRHAPRQGSRFGFGGRISGDESGFDRAVCTAIGNLRTRNRAAKVTLCTIQLELSKGSLSLQGMTPQQSRNTPLAITGGTGAYDGARGTAIVTDVSQTRGRINITLLP